jgi:hypothetical protein
MSRTIVFSELFKTMGEKRVRSAGMKIVPATTLDSEWTELGRSGSLLHQLDIEGADRSASTGGRGLIQAIAPLCVLGMIRG